MLSHALVTCPKSLEHWLYFEDSLSDKLEKSLGEIQVHVLQQGWRDPQWWDLYFLRIAQEAVFCREITILQNKETYWYARSLIPASCYALNPAFFGRLESESIRHLIFGVPEVERLALQIYPMDKGCIEYYWVKKCYPVDREPLPIWVRLGTYAYQQTGRFYVIEILFSKLGNVL